MVHLDGGGGGGGESNRQGNTNGGQYPRRQNLGKNVATRTKSQSLPQRQCTKPHSRNSREIITR